MKTFVVAEIGANWEGSIKKAEKKEVKKPVVEKKPVKKVVKKKVVKKTPAKKAVK